MNENATPATGTTTQDVAAFLALLPPQGRLIGIDAGTKTLGLTLSDITRMIASPLGTIQRKKFALDAARLLALTQDHHVGGYVASVRFYLAKKL